MAGSGHIAGVVNPPELKKYQHWTGGKPEGAFEDWIASAVENPGRGGRNCNAGSRSRMIGESPPASRGKESRPWATHPANFSKS